MIELSKFCAGDIDIRTYLHKPFTFDGSHYVFASDGCIAIRVHKADGYIGDVIPAHNMKPVASGDIFTMGNDSFHQPITVAAPARDADCDCSWHGADECPDCEGNGEFEHGNHDYVCMECNGTGKVGMCTKCGGTRKYFGYVDINGARFNGLYIALIAELPYATLSVNVADGKPSLFSFDGGVGAVMPVRVR